MMTNNDDHDAIDDTLGGRISLARDAAGLTVAEAADHLGVMPQSWNAWECDGSLPRANRVTMMAGILGVSPSWLLSGIGQGPVEPGRSDDKTVLLEDFQKTSREIAVLNQRMQEIVAKLSNGTTHSEDSRSGSPA